MSTDSTDTDRPPIRGYDPASALHKARGHRRRELIQRVFAALIEADHRAAAQQLRSAHPVRD